MKYLSTLAPLVNSTYLTFLASSTQKRNHPIQFTIKTNDVPAHLTNSFLVLAQQPVFLLEVHFSDL